MSFDIDILEEKENSLIKRKEIKFRIETLGEGTPNRLDIKKKIATMKNTEEKLTIIRNIQSHFGATHVIGKVHIYEDSDQLQFFEPFHIQVRNLGKDKRAEIYKLKKRKEPYKHLFEYQ